MDTTLALTLYREMLQLREFELKVQELYRRGLLPGFVHLYVGEEAVAVGAVAALRDTDLITSTHRGHGHALAKGIPPGAIIAELLGRASGCSNGRGGSMHLFAPEIGFYGSSGIVGPGILLAAGAGYTSQLLKQGFVGVAFFGDGGANNGAFYEGLNLAAAYQLPVIFVCENNLYATEIALKSVTHNPEIAARAAALGLPGVAVDGEDVLAVYNAAHEAVERARAGGGPTLLECNEQELLAALELGLHAQAQAADALTFTGLYDTVLLDAPCSGLGTIRKKPDIKWNRTPADITKKYPALQSALLNHLSTLVKVGGSIVYSTCTNEPEETNLVIEAFLEQNPGYVLSPLDDIISPELLSGDKNFLRTWPHKHNMDGFFAVKLRKTK